MLSEKILFQLFFLKYFFVVKSSTHAFIGSIIGIIIEPGGFFGSISSHSDLNASVKNNFRQQKTFFSLGKIFTNPLEF